MLKKMEQFLKEFIALIDSLKKILSFTEDEKIQKIMELEEEIVLYHKTLKRLNGTNIIFENKEKEILLGWDKYHQMFALPGGAIERGELPKESAQSEAREETGIIADVCEMHYLGMFLQRLPKAHEVRGFVYLYVCQSFTDTELQKETKEMTDIQFYNQEFIMNLIMNQPEKIGRGYAKMLLQYFRIRDGYDHRNFEKRLSDDYDYLWNGKLISFPRHV